MARGRLTKPRPKSVYDVLGLLALFHCSIVCLFCSPALRDIIHIPVARYSLFMLIVPLNTN